MNGIFIINDPSFLEKNSGIGKKINNQVKIFNDNGLICKTVLQKSGREKMPNFLGKAIFLLPFSNVSPKWEWKEEYQHIDFIYVRRPVAMSFSMRSFLKKCKKNNPKLKIFLEIPTYPYDGEFEKGLKQILLWRDRYNRTKLQGLVDRVFVIDPSEQITDFYGAPATVFLNGYDVKNCKVRTYKEHGNRIILTCVGMFNFWHGYERLIYGLYEYYKKGGNESIYIEMVGSGKELNYYKRLAIDLQLKQFVNFYGVLYGDDLEEVYNRTDIAFSSLGRYKNNITIVGDLKTREYLAKGIPTVSGCTVDLFKNSNDCPFYLEVENNNKPIDMELIVSFYYQIQMKRSSHSIEQELHNYALNTYDTSTTLVPVISSMIKDLKNN